MLILFLGEVVLLSLAGGVVGLGGGIGLAAGIVPALHAARLDPIEALRGE